MVTITIDGKKFEVEERRYLLDVCEDNGIPIPTLCHRKGLEPYGACRVCLVEMERGGRVRFVTACNFPVKAGMNFQTASKRIVEIRKLIVESLMARCPGAEALKELGKSMGIEKSRFPAEGDGTEKCILCGLCVRVCQEIVGASALSFVGRGIEREVGTAFGYHPESCIGCGACTSVCPTGAIDMEKVAAGEFKNDAGSDRLCRYARMGLIAAALCANSFECFRCPVDQRFLEAFKSHPAFVRDKLGAGEEAGSGSGKP